LENKLKGDLLKKKHLPWRKKGNFNPVHLPRHESDTLLAIAGITKHQYYHCPSAKKRGKATL
jgi:hypothetical protein